MITLNQQCTVEALERRVTLELETRGMKTKQLAQELHGRMGCAAGNAQNLINYFKEGYVFGRIGMIRMYNEEATLAQAKKRSFQLGVFLEALEIAPDDPLISEVRACYLELQVGFEYPPRGELEPQGPRERLQPRRNAHRDAPTEAAPRRSLQERIIVPDAGILLYRGRA